jgi:hypothetical protein
VDRVNVVEQDTDLRVIWTEDVLLDLEGAVQMVKHDVRLAKSLVDDGEIVKADGDLVVVRSEPLALEYR